ncbi:MAG: calcium/sodium antiporter [Firmicutes bacterium]|jgi:cation:H+ antiporter|nr:calcium/sodium antiporter [Bacillota bacterium]
MPDLHPFIMFALGLFMIIKGSDWFVDAVVWLARALKIPDLIIGATLVSICTTLPETTVSAGAALKGNTSIALGNALGSIACNTGLVLAIIIIFAEPLLKDRAKLQKNGIFLMILLILITAIAFIFKEIPRFAGCLLLAVLAWYLYNNVRESLDTREYYAPRGSSRQEKSGATIAKNLAFFAIGLVLIIWGSDLLVANGEIIARLAGVPDIVIGLTLTAFGTSLPELMTAITAIRKQVHGISIGNILGANILNVIWVIGLSATILPINIDPVTLRLHFPFVFLIVAATVAFTYLSKRRFVRGQGLFLLAMYAFYLFLTLS